MPAGVASPVIVEIRVQGGEGEELGDAPAASEALGGEEDVLPSSVVVEELYGYLDRVDRLPPASTRRSVGDGNAAEPPVVEGSGGGDM